MTCRLAIPAVFVAAVAAPSDGRCADRPIPPDPSREAWLGSRREGVPLDGSIVESLARPATSLRDQALAFTCMERATETEYAHGEPHEDTLLGSSFYLLAIDPRTDDVRELRTNNRGDLHVARPLEKWLGRIPSAWSWATALAPENISWLFLSDLGVHDECGERFREIRFASARSRGALDVTSSWEGRVTVRDATMEPVLLHAWPRDQRERLELALDRYRRSTRIGFSVMGIPLFSFRTKPAPPVIRCAVRFERQLETVVFPSEVRYDAARMNERGDVRPVQSLRLEYSRFQRFDVKSVPRPQTKPASRGR